MRLKTYVRENLNDELPEVLSSQRNTELADLDVFEKTISYHYSEERYDNLNERLRDLGGKQLSAFVDF